jgi:hypothetical protein
VASAFGGIRPRIDHDSRELPTLDNVADIIYFCVHELSLTGTQVATNSLRRATLVLPALIEQEQAHWRMVESPKGLWTP